MVGLFTPAMAPRNPALWTHSVHLSKICPRLFESTHHAYARLQEVKTILAKKGADLMAPCDSKTREGCQVFNHLNALNDVMDGIKVHIKGLVSTRELAVSFLGKTYAEPEPQKRIEQALVLLHWLFVKHDCVAKIVLDNPLLFKNPDRVAFLCSAIGECRGLKTLWVNIFMNVAHYRQLLTACSCFQDLEALSFKLIPDGNNVGNMDILAAIVARNRKLVLLHRLFLKALAVTDFVKDVFVTPCPSGYPSELFCTAAETGTASRISSGPMVTNESSFTNLPRRCLVKKLILRITPDDEEPMLHVCFANLGKLSHVTSLIFDMRRSIVDVSAAELLAVYLRNTKILDAVTLRFLATKESSAILLDAISRNTSVTNLEVDRWCLDRRRAAVLADIVSSSKFIHTLTYNQKGMFPSRAFFSRLSGSIHRNVTIVSVDTFQLRKNARNWGHIRSVAARNATFLERAARFVARLSSQKSDAEAFELVSSSPLLLVRVQELAATDKCGAAKMIQRAIWDMKDIDVYMAVNGVVKGSVVCEKSGDFRPSLDTLPPECWHAIRRYLTVADVVNTKCDGK
ncbi:hypothetical protein HPB50_013459 [Hyalomma asiaticum]|uniref:Uncharacterized protein n=1 Tax=Hyalomma asiaticum TaxID=266040 RepID=A0ACB7S944_HYAAI|nr:hypothetical protein HPB50_013459 [Hyalomma asiaticum]